MSVPELFDRHARRLRRDRVRRGDAFIAALIAERLLDRLDAVTRRFARALLIGADPALAAALRDRGATVTVIDPAPGRAARLDGRAVEEDRLDLPSAGYDLVLAAGTLDTVADLPGALILLRRALEPDGLFLGALVGAPSLPLLRRLVAGADGVQGMAVQRFHPLIDARAAGELLVRAGFALPVADAETLRLSYGSLDRLIGDLRDAALTNILPQRRAFSRVGHAALHAAFELARDGDRAEEELTIVSLTGWSPADTQPRPTQRGSGRVSLAAALKPQRSTDS